MSKKRVPHFSKCPHLWVHYRSLPSSPPPPLPPTRIWAVYWLLRKKAKTILFHKYKTLKPPTPAGLPSWLPRYTAPRHCVRPRLRADRGGTAMVIPVCRHLDTNHKKVRAWRTRPYLACTTGSDFLMVSRKQDGHGITIAVPPRSARSLGLTQWRGAFLPIT